jgi:hypothetical protein
MLVDLFATIVVGYAAAVLFFFARKLGTGLRSAYFVAASTIVLSFAFNTLLTMLLFVPINERIPFWVNDVPQWLRP